METVIVHLETPPRLRVGRVAPERWPAVDAHSSGHALRLHVLSDRGGAAGRYACPPTRDFDVVVAAGNLTKSAVGTLRWLRRSFPEPVPIVAVLGPEEFRGADHRRVLKHARWVARALRIELLEDRATVVGGVRYLGATL